MEEDKKEIGHKAGHSKKNSEHEAEHNNTRTSKHKKDTIATIPIIALMVVVALVMLFNQLQINGISNVMGSGFGSGVSILNLGAGPGGKDIEHINLDEIKSTGHTIAAVFPV